MAAPDCSYPVTRFLPLETVAVRLRAPARADLRMVFGIVSNISETGGCVIINLPLAAGTEVSLSIETPRRKEALEVSARVVWCAERFEPVKEIIGYMTGVCFDPEAVASVRDLMKSGVFQAMS